MSDKIKNREPTMWPFTLIIIGAALSLIAQAVKLIDPPPNPREVEAIERGYALYCPKNGEFAWKGECGE